MWSPAGHSSPSPPIPVESRYWTLPADQLLARLDTTPGGLSTAEAVRRLSELAPPGVAAGDRYRKTLRLLFRQFASPLVLILLLGAGLSLLLQNWIDAVIMLTVLLATGLVGFVQEFRASRAVEALETRLALKARVLRDGQPASVMARDVVPGDIVELSAGDLIPADGLVLQATDFLVTEAALTGESLPVEKEPGVLTADAGLADRSNAVFAGTSVRSGMARVVVVLTGGGTVLGAVEEDEGAGAALVSLGNGAPGAGLRNAGANQHWLADTVGGGRPAAGRCLLPRLADHGGLARVVGQDGGLATLDLDLNEPC